MFKRRTLAHWRAGSAHQGHARSTVGRVGGDLQHKPALTAQPISLHRDPWQRVCRGAASRALLAALLLGFGIKLVSTLPRTFHLDTYSSPQDSTLQACIRVLVASPYPLLCAGLCATLEAERQIIVVGEAFTCPEAFQLYAELGPDALILDTLLFEFPMMSALAKLCSNSPKTIILAVVSRHDVAAVPGLVALGVSGCILKEDRADVLVSAITGIAAGATWFSPAVWLRQN